MFEVPQAKRIKREDLFRQDDDDDDDSPPTSSPRPSSSGSTSPDKTQEVGGTDEEVVKPDYGFEYDFITPKSDEREKQETNQGQISNGVQHNDDDDDDDDHPNEEQEPPMEYQFRLFTSSSTSTKPKQQSTIQQQPLARKTIRLSVTPPPEDFIESTLSLEKAGFIRPNRPDDYYFTSSRPMDVIETLKSQYSQSALSNFDVLNRAESTKWPGTSLPWRCIRVTLINPDTKKKSIDSNERNTTTTTTTTTTAAAAASTTTTTTTIAHRPRPSKKRRILQRRRLALREELALQSQKVEELERQKRTQRNREKKVKRKEREKLKKKQQQQQQQQQQQDLPQGVDEKEGEKVEPASSPSTTTSMPAVDV